MLGWAAVCVASPLKKTERQICAPDTGVPTTSPSFESILLSLPGGGTLVFGIPASSSQKWFLDVALVMY